MKRSPSSPMFRFARIACLLPALALLSPALSATEPVDPVMAKIIEIGRRDNRTMKHLDVLCHRFGGRPIGSAAYDNAADWAGRKFREWGMQVVYEEAGRLAVGFNRGPWFGKMTSPECMHLHFATPSYSAGTRGRVAAPAVREPKDAEEFARMKKRIAGAWVLLNPEPEEKRDPSRPRPTYQERMQQRKKQQEKREARLQKLEDAGALGVIESAKVPITATYNRGILKWKSWEDLPNLCEILLDEHQFARIRRMIDERRRVELEFDIRNHFKMGPVPYHNVIGVIPGTEFPEEYVIISGHLDAYDVATGAVDNGNGVTTSMEAARLIMAAGGKPRRTILVTLWSGEEFGILGAGHWVKEHQDRLPRVSAMFNRDGGPTVPTGIYAGKAMWPDLAPICRMVNTINPEFPFELMERKARPRPEGPVGSDSSVFAMHGVPTFWLPTADPKGYDFRYREIWHTENDYFQKSIPEYQEHAAIVRAVLAYGVANLDHLLPRTGFYLTEKEARAYRKAQEKARRQRQAKKK